MSECDERGAIVVASALRAARRAVEYAHWRSDPLDRAALLNLVAEVWAVEDINRLRTVLARLDLRGSDREDFIAALERMLAVGESVPSPDKARVDAFAYWAVQQLPTADARSFVSAWLVHRRKARRRFAYKLARRMELESFLNERLVLAWERFEDVEAVHALVRIPNAMRAVDVDAVLRGLDRADDASTVRDNYWQARVLERLLRDNPPEALGRSAAYPAAFIRALGRVGNRVWLPQARRCFRDGSNDPHILGIAASVAGRMEDRTLLRMVEDALSNHESTFAALHPWYRPPG